MFSKLVSRNSKRDRKNNGLYFSSMVLSIISFYIILSLSHQDVMHLIEASAGTGKTYGIAALFTRLIVLEKKDIENKIRVI